MTTRIAIDCDCLQCQAGDRIEELSKESETATPERQDEIDEEMIGLHWKVSTRGAVAIEPAKPRMKLSFKGGIGPHGIAVAGSVKHV